MTQHLLLVTIGPVQDFIAQARRTRDLWFGSHLLSELSRAAARALAEGGAELIFPALAREDEELTLCKAPLRESGPAREDWKPPQNIGNKILAVVPADRKPEDLAKRARTEVERCWREDFADEVKTKCDGLLAPGIDKVWDEQIETFVEFVAAWHVLPVDQYKATRDKVEKTVAGRKCLRDFDAWSCRRGGRGNVPKSSLDGARETVLRKPGGKPGEREKELTRKYRIADGEQLDAVGLVKRAGGDPEQFVPVVNVALASWLVHAETKAKDELRALRSACATYRIPPINRDDIGWVKALPYDGSVLFKSRWKSLFEELGIEKEKQEQVQKAAQSLLDKMPEPSPYVACLVADGDKMGETIDKLESSEDHQEFTKALSGFALKARDFVTKHLGALVYAGGDDVLAFVSVPTALDCAFALQLAFKEAMKPFDGKVERLPTLSVGLGIGHNLEPMGKLLQLVRDAEREAKIDRDALAIVLDKRSGGTCTWRAKWNPDPVQLMKDSMALIPDGIPSRKIYEIKSVLDRLPDPEKVSEADWANVLWGEVNRSLGRIERGELSLEDGRISIPNSKDYKQLHEEITAWVNRMIIARTLKRAEVEPPRNKESEP